MLGAHISLTYRAHGTEDSTADAADRPGQERGVRAPVLGPGPDPLPGRASADPRLPDAARRALRPERQAGNPRTGRGAGALSAGGEGAFEGGEIRQAWPVRPS